MRRHFILALLLAAMAAPMAWAQPRLSHRPPGDTNRGPGSRPSQSGGPWREPMFSRPSASSSSRLEHVQQRRDEDRQHEHRGEWLRKHQNQSPQEQERALERDPEFNRLPPDRQQRLRQRLRDFNSRPPEQRQQMIQRMEHWDRLSPQQKDQALRVFNQMRGLSPERQQAIHRAAHDLSALPPQQREQALNSPAMRNQFSDNERDTLRNMLDLNLPPAHGGARPH